MDVRYSNQQIVSIVWFYLVNKCFILYLAQVQTLRWMCGVLVVSLNTESPQSTIYKSA